MHVITVKDIGDSYFLRVGDAIAYVAALRVPAADISYSYYLPSDLVSSL